MPFVLSIVGKSDAGKTTLLLNVLPELKKRGYKVAAVKHCPHGFDLDVEGKDSWKFSAAGADGIFLTSPHQIAVMKKMEDISPPVKELIDRFFYDFDLVLIEGLKGDPTVKKIEILRKGISESVETPPGELAAVVADFPLEMEKPVFPLDDINGIVGFIEGLMKQHREPEVRLRINERAVPLNQFVRNLFKSTILGMVEPLRKEDPRVKEVEIVVKK